MISQTTFSPSDRYAIAERAFPLLFFVDADFRIVGQSASFPENLLPWKRALESGGIHEGESTGFCRRALVPPHYVITCVPLEGVPPLSMAISVEIFRGRANLSPAIKSFSLTSREVEILQHMLEGRTACQIAQYLCLAETTVQSYFKRLLEKTQARNRASMAAKILGWRS